MTTLNARASQAWHAAVDGTTEEPFDGIARDAFEEGWETGYKTAREDVMEAVEWLHTRAKDEAVGTADTRWGYKRAADFLARMVSEPAAGE